MLGRAVGAGGPPTGARTRGAVAGKCSPGVVEVTELASGTGGGGAAQPGNCKGAPQDAGVGGGLAGVGNDAPVGAGNCSAVRAGMAAGLPAFGAGLWGA